MAAILTEMALEPDCTFQPAAQLFQDFTVRCRDAAAGRHGHRSGGVPEAFRRWRWPALPTIGEPRWQEVLRIGRDVSDDLLAPFLVLARAAAEGTPCPDDDKLAEVYGTRSPGRIRRLLEHLERSGLIVVRTDYGGRRSIGIPELGLTTAPMAA